MKYRSHMHEESFDLSPEQMFELLITPSAIRGWWGASRAIVVPKLGGTWTAAWGDEDDPDYISTAILVEYEPPKRLAMKYGEYYAKTGSLPFKFSDDALTIFTIDPDSPGSRLRVEQSGFPFDPVADEFYSSCEVGWTNTFAGIRAYLCEKQL